MAKISLIVAGKDRVKAQFLAATASMVAGVLNIISKAKITKATSEYLDEELVTASIGSQKPFTLMVADIRGAYKEYRDKLAKPDEALPLWVDGNGKTLDADKIEGFINPKLKFLVENGTFMVNR